MIHVNNFANGALNPALSYVVSCVGCFLGLRCTTRARAHQGAARARWLTLAALSIGTTGIWVMHFIAMLGFAIPGEAIRYNVPFTILSMVIAVVVVGIGVFIVGFSRRAGNGPLVLGGTILGVGVASMHYLGMGAVRVDASLTYNYGLVAASVIIAVIAGTAALWMALRLDSVWSTFVASLVAGVAVNGMHYTGMAAVQAHAAPGLAVSTADTAGATAFLLPLILGLSGVGFIFSALIALSPTAAEIVEESELMKRIGQSQAAQGQAAQNQPARGQPTRGQATRGQAMRNGSQGWRPPPPQPYQAPREEPGPDEPGSLFRPRRPSDRALTLPGRQCCRGDLTAGRARGARSTEAGSFGRMRRLGPWPWHLPAMGRPATAARRSVPCSGAA
jgi:NO-binding membrane sensor protein with MHYT domain